jgi:hypothetical protein
MSPLEQAKKSILAASIGSCDCNTKSPEPSYHAGHCRYLKLLQALDCLDDLVEPARFINCEACQTESRVYTADGNNPDWTDHGVCPECNGERVVEVETQPITLADMTKDHNTK